MADTAMFGELWMEGFSKAAAAMGLNEVQTADLLKEAARLAVAQTPAFKEGYEAELNKSAQAGGMLRRVGRMGAMAALPLAGFGAGEMYGSPTNFITRHWNKGPGEQASDQHLMNLMRLPLHEREMAMSDFDRRRKLSLQQALGPEWWQQHNRNMMYNMGGMGAGGSDLGLSYM